MKKSHLILLVLLLMVIGYATTQIKLDISGSTELSENISDFKVYLDNLKLNGTEIEGINETKDGYEIKIPSKGTLEYNIINDSTEYDVEVSVECEEEKEENKVTEFNYTGGEQTFMAPMNGIYKLETWGASGGNATSTYIGGYGGYSIGQVSLTKYSNLYINVGGSGNANTNANDKNLIEGGYNGGGHSKRSADTSGNASSGGGATHIAKTSGLLTTFENKVNDILIVSAGGGGSSYHVSNSLKWYGKGGHAGGYKGSSAYDCYDAYNGSKGYFCGVGGTQTESYNPLDSTGAKNGSFGSGALISNTGNIGGGGGLYGGTSGTIQAGGGGSSYIGNPLLTEKSMYCYNCEESTEESTKTISTTCVSSTPTENCAKSGNGYARVTLINGINSIVQLEQTTIEAQDNVKNKIEIENNGIKCSLKIKKLSRTEKKIYTGPTEWTFDYTGGEQSFTIPTNGTYMLETWGAQGGYGQYNTSGIKYGGYGGYSVGSVTLLKNEKLFINVGGQGGQYDAGFNGGGKGAFANSSPEFSGGGGGATHIALSSGLLSSFSDKQELILIVSAGGGGGSTCATENVKVVLGGGSGGGINGNANVRSKATGATQTSGGKVSAGVGNVGSFGLGGDGYVSSLSRCASVGGGGGGFYGGASNNYSGTGGSGYIGNAILKDKAMYCYNCTKSTEESTKTISTTCTNSSATSNCAKQGNGYVRITLIK